LEEAGIVTSSLSKTGGAGRPRKLYLLADLHDGAGRPTDGGA
jgi:predicted transcriptional regulator